MSSKINPFDNKPNKAPCLNCEDRVAGCHSKCDRYKAYRAEVERARNVRQTVRSAEAGFIEHHQRLGNMARHRKK